MFFPPKLYLKDYSILGSISTSAVFLVLVLWYVASNISPTTEQLFLHYNIIFGVDLIGPWWRMWFLPSVAFLMLVLNFAVSYFLYEKYRFLSRFTAIMTAVTEVLLFVGTILIVGLNI